jgi:hypothetical protein
VEKREADDHVQPKNSTWPRKLQRSKVSAENPRGASLQRDPGDADAATSFDVEVTALVLGLYETEFVWAASFATPELFVVFQT